MLASALLSLLLPVLSLGKALNKRIDNSNLTPDGYSHNRYHALLAMAVYGDYNTQCPERTFLKASELKNFPNATRPPWQVISNFGPTPSGCEGFTVIVPEMNKAVIVFKGNYKLEQTLPIETVSWQDGFGVNSTTCVGCTVNAFAAKGYSECKKETNNWAAIREAYAGQGLVFSITGHGLGGMHSLIAAADFNYQLVDYYAHNYGTPRTFNTLGANHYNSYFNGEAAERGVYGNDTYTEYIPAGGVYDYAHAGTAFYYWGYSATLTGPNVQYCFDGNNPSGNITDDPGCTAGWDTTETGSTPEQDHYYYFSNVGECGAPVGSPSRATNQSTAVADAFIAAAKAAPAIGATSAPINVQGTATGTSSSADAGATSKTGGAASSLVNLQGLLLLGTAGFMALAA